MNFKRYGKWIAGILVLSIPVLADSCIQFRMNSSEIRQYFSNRGIEAEELSYRSGHRQINYVRAGNATLPLVLFVHGSPGSLSAFISFLSDSVLLQNAQLVSVDRPGFGASGYGRAESSLKKQAELLMPIVEKYRKNGPVTLVGHSLGGPVIARMAMDYPEQIGGLIMVAPSIDPDLEPNEWFRGPLALPLLKWMLPRWLRASNDEIWKLKPELQDMMPLWSTIKAPTIVIQGGKDTLVPAGNADFAKRMITGAPVQLVLKEELNHFIPWNNPGLIKEAILQMVSGDQPVTSLSSH